VGVAINYNQYHVLQVNIAVVLQSMQDNLLAQHRHEQEAKVVMYEVLVASAQSAEEQLEHMQDGDN
jgi:hypothetical protein